MLAFWIVVVIGVMFFSAAAFTFLIATPLQKHLENKRLNSTVRFVK